MFLKGRNTGGQFVREACSTPLKPKSSLSLTTPQPSQDDLVGERVFTSENVEKEVPGVTAMEISQLETKYRMTVHSSSVSPGYITKD